MAHKAPGKAHREGITLLELARLFPDENAAIKWFEAIRWPSEERDCPRCGSTNTHECSHSKMPYRCRACKRYFSVKTGSAMGRSPIPLLKWLYAIYLDATSLKGVSSMKLHRDLGVTQKTAWFMQQRIREAFTAERGDSPFSGPVEVDETYFGGKRKNMSNAKRKIMSGRGTIGKTAVAGMKDRETGEVVAMVVSDVGTETLQSFVHEHLKAGEPIFTDDAAVYRDLPNHGSVKHSVGEYVRGMVHTNGIESFWSMLKRAHKGTFHKLSPKHLQRYVDEFVGRHNVRDLNTLAQMALLSDGMTGRRLTYKVLIADNGLNSMARSK